MHALLADVKLLLELPDHVSCGRDARGSRCSRAEEPHEIVCTHRKAAGEFVGTEVDSVIVSFAFGQLPHVGVGLIGWPPNTSRCAQGIRDVAAEGLTVIVKASPSSAMLNCSTRSCALFGAGVPHRTRHRPAKRRSRRTACARWAVAFFTKKLPARTAVAPFQVGDPAIGSHRLSAYDCRMDFPTF